MQIISKIFLNLFMNDQVGFILGMQRVKTILLPMYGLHREVF